MAVAGRDSAEALTRLAEEQAETRRRNADEADAFRVAREDGRVLQRLPIHAVGTDSLPRDRMALEQVAQAPEMDELKASIRARGQREAVEVWSCADETHAPRWQLKSGWRRLEALRQLHAETGEGRFATVLARVVDNTKDRVGLYLAMVEENAVREDVSFAEMANVALAMTRDPIAGVATVDEAVTRLYGSLQKTKRSNIRRFVDLLGTVGDLLPAPRDIPKNLGADAARAVMQSPELVTTLRKLLTEAEDAAQQNAALDSVVAMGRPEPSEGANGKGGATGVSQARQKYEFHHAGMKVTARPGEVRIRCDEDFAKMPRDQLEAAIAAFRAQLNA
jgi:ParB family chromosome partitioning protein